MLEKEQNIEAFYMNEELQVEVSGPEDFKTGFGFGNEDGLSHVARRSEVGEQVVATVEAAIASNEILKPVSKEDNGDYIDDDGCGDGRGVKRVFRGTIEKAKSLIRPKIFGGGATMMTAMEIGLGQARGKTLNGMFSTAIGILRSRNIDFGAHTDEHAHGEACGCGAIDKAPQVIANVATFEDEIIATIAKLPVDSTGLNEVMASFRQYAQEIDGQPYSGRKVMDEIVDNGKIVKELADEHKEMFILLNLVEGYTVDQELIRKVSNEQIQVFTVDVWRLQALAARRYPDDEAARNKAFLSELVYTLGVGATLTMGDLPVRVLQKKDVAVAA